MERTLVGLSLLFMLISAGCGAAPNAAQPDASGALDPVPAEYAGKTNPLGPEAATAGTQVYQSNCEACHGPRGHGDGPAGVALQPAPKNLAELNKTAGDDYLFWRISTGRPGTAMPPWQGVLSDQQIWQAVSFIRTLK
jgi:mono/diheme cytochrome c family protein